MNQANKQMYIIATKAQIETTELMMKSETIAQIREVIAIDKGAADYLKKMFDSTLSEVEDPAMQAAMLDEDIRVVTEELHSKVRQVRNELFPEALN